MDLFSIDWMNFLATVDYWSNFYDWDQIQSTKSAMVGRCLKRLFAHHSIPDEVITDNGPQFTALSLKQFADNWLFRHTTSSQYFPQSNGLVGTTVKTAKTLIQTALHSGEDVWLSILAHRNTPPVQTLFSCCTKTQLPMVEELLEPQVLSKESVLKERTDLQEQQRHYFNRSEEALESLEDDTEVCISALTLPSKENVHGTV